MIYCRLYYSKKNQAKIQYTSNNYTFVCLFWVFHHTREMFTHMEMSPLPVKDCKYFDLCFALVAIEQ